MNPITYGTVCSGIEAPSVAWEGLGWLPTFFSEIEAFPRQVLHQRQKAFDAARTGAAMLGVPLWGDFTAMRMRFFRRLGIHLPDVLCGGTPCQAFSLAGLRQSLDDARGNLTLEYVRLANAIDNERRRLGRGGIVIAWENVPGVLSTKDNAFGCFLAGLVGADAPLVPPSGLRWTDAGLVAGPRRVAAWRILDSQYFGLAQRRRRVFVVACPLEGPDPAEILPECDSVRRDHPPSREEGARVAPTIARGAPNGGRSYGLCADTAEGLIAGTLQGNDGGADDNDARAGRLIAFGGNNTSGPIDVATTLNASHTSSGRQDFETETFIAQVSPTLRARDGAKGVDSDATDTLIPTAFRTAGDGGVYEEGEVIAPLTTGTDACASVVAFSCKDHRADASEIAPTLRAMGHAGSHMNGGGQVAVALSLRGREGGGTAELGGDVMPALRCGGGGGDKPHALMSAGVRRLMPVECERLQGFPDEYTAIEVRGDIATDSPRYKALGNSMSVPVMEWIGRRIDRAIRAHRMGSAA